MDFSKMLKRHRFQPSKVDWRVVSKFGAIKGTKLKKEKQTKKVKVKVKVNVYDPHVVAREMKRTYALAKELKTYVNPKQLQHMRFGLDFESKQCFVEIKAALFWKLWTSSIDSFVNSIRSEQKRRMKVWENELGNKYGQELFEEVKRYFASYCQKHPDYMDWHRESRHA